MTGSISGLKFTENGDNIDITVFQGRSISFEYIYGGDTPVNVIGMTARLQARKSAGSTVLADFTVANGRVTVGGANGKFTFTMSASDCAALPLSNGVYELIIINGSNTITAMSGKWGVEQQIVA